MYRITSGSNHALEDTVAFIGLLNDRQELLSNGAGDLFTSGEILVSRAPGRIDLMGGIADYSGSLVLQVPIASATHVALQLRDDTRLRLVSLPPEAGDSPRLFEINLAEFLGADGPIDYPAAQQIFGRNPNDHWAAYVAGAFLVLMREKGCAFERGAALLISSTVPEGKGVSSSAALEVAAMQSIVAAFQIEIESREIAFLCQKVENLIAAAPCGVMDQMTAACGERDRLLLLLCQPGEIKARICLPGDLAVWGLDSGIRHSVGSADYRTVRTAAFMGYRIIAEISNLPLTPSDKPGLVQVTDNKWHGYLANITPDEFEHDFAPQLPQQMSGAEFLEQYEGITDPVTSVKPDKTYPVLQASRHPIYENARVTSFVNQLKMGTGSRQTEILGELMYQSHGSYSACGLGSTGTDAIVRLVREAGPRAGLFGAKITGGGSGGTVAVLGHREARSSIRAIVEQYAQRTGYRPTVISGSSPGAGPFGYLRLAEGA